MKVVIVAAHADDEVLGCGGTIARHVAHGDEVSLILATEGHPDIFGTKIVETIRQECSASCEELGIKEVIRLPFLAPQLDTVPQHRLADELGRALSTIRPNILYTHFRWDCHLDHQLVAQATMVATRPIRGFFIERILAYETLSETEWGLSTESQAFLPQWYVDVSAFLPRKIAAMNCYRSQVQDFPHPRSIEGITALAKQRGSQVSLHAAEAFQLLRACERDL